MDDSKAVAIWFNFFPRNVSYINIGTFVLEGLGQAPPFFFSLSFPPVCSPLTDLTFYEPDSHASLNHSDQLDLLKTMSHQQAQESY